MTSIAMSKIQGETSRTWLIFAVSLFLSLSVVNFLASVIGRDAALPSAAALGNFQAQMLTVGAVGVVGSITTLLLCPKRASKTAKRITVMQLINGMLIASANLAIVYGLGKYPKYAPFITAVLPMNAVLVAAACWLLLHQPLTRLQSFGVLLSFFGLVGMAAADGNTEGLPGLAFGALGALGLGFGNFGLKPTATNRLDKVWGACALAVGLGIGGLVVLCILAGQGHNPFYGLYDIVAEDGSSEASRKLVVLAAVSGLLQILVTISVKLAVALGPAAPATAIGNANAVGVLLLDVIVYHSTASMVKVVGLLLVVLGVVVMAFAAPVKSSQNMEAKGALVDL
jgi:drug/metabolite transporter (DMT)-like permease